MADHGYDRQYMRARRLLLSTAPTCSLRLACDGALATTADHQPPLIFHAHVPGTACCRLLPACAACQSRQGQMISTARRKGFMRPRPAPSRPW